MARNNDSTMTRKRKHSSTTLTDIISAVRNKIPKLSPLLPTEILHQICSNLDTGSVAAFRLASRNFADIGKEHLVEELCFFLHPRSIEKVFEIAGAPEWATRVKSIVLEHVGAANTETLERQNGGIPVELERDIFSYLLSRSENLRMKACWIILTRLRKAIGCFKNLEAISLHNGFKADPRDNSKDKVLLERNFNSNFEQYISRTSTMRNNQLSEQLLWHDHPSLRFYQAPNLMEVYQNTSMDNLEALHAFSGLVKMSFDAREGHSRALKKLNTLNIQTYLPEALKEVSLPAVPSEQLSRSSARSSTYATSGLKHLNIEYCQPAPESLHARSDFDKDYSFTNDVKRLSSLRLGFESIRTLTLTSHADHPSEWLDLTPFGQYRPSMPLLEQLNLTNCSLTCTQAAQWMRSRKVYLTLKNVAVSEEVLQGFANGSCAQRIYISGLLAMECKPNKTGCAWIVGDEITAQVTWSRFRELLLDQGLTFPSTTTRVSSEALGAYMMRGGTEVLNDAITAWSIKSFVEVQRERDVLIAATISAEKKYQEESDALLLLSLRQVRGDRQVG